VKALAHSFKLPLLSENWKSIIETGYVYQKLQREKSSEADIAKAFSNVVDSYFTWLNERKRLYSSHKGFIADRWEADLLSFWLIVFSRRKIERVDQATIKLMEDMRVKAKTFSFAVVLPPQQTVQDDRNEDGLRRVQSLTLRVRDGLLMSALVRQCSDLPILSIPAQPFVVEDRLAIVERAIQKNQTSCSLHNISVASGRPYL
jgi:hypothetical protein